jgi:transcriptional regulator with XRE-family HTH domain
MAAEEHLGPWIRQWRHARRWTQEHLAEALGYEVSYVAKIERGQRRASRQFVARLAEVAEVDVPELEQMTRWPSAKLRLPVSRNPVFGRERELQELGHLLREQRCVSLVGAPGIGKTTLALEAAWRSAGDFRHGGCFVGLAEVSSSGAVTSSVLHGLGLMERSGVELDEVLLQALRDRELLLILDNFEHVLEARSIVSSLVEETDNIHILLTSREALGLACETQYWVQPLAFPDPVGAVPEDLRDYPAVKVFGLYATKRGERPLIRAAGRVCHSTPQWRRTLSLKLSKLRKPWATRRTFLTRRFTASVGPFEAPVR